MFSSTLSLTSALRLGGWLTPSPGRFLLLVLQSFDWLAAFHLELLQAFLFIAV
jgi:hypothetical protein